MNSNRFEFENQKRNRKGLGKSRKRRNPETAQPSSAQEPNPAPRPVLLFSPAQPSGPVASHSSPAARSPPSALARPASRSARYCLQPRNQPRASAPLRSTLRQPSARASSHRRPGPTCRRQQSRVNRVPREPLMPWPHLSFPSSPSSRTLRPCHHARDLRPCFPAGLPSLAQAPRSPAPL